MVIFKRILLSLSCVSVCAVILSGCSKEDAGTVPGLQIVRVRGAISFKNQNVKDPSRWMYNGLVYCKDFLGIYEGVRGFRNMSIMREMVYVMNSSDAPSKAEVWVAPEVGRSFTPDSSATYNPDLIVTVLAVADISDGRTIDKKFEMHLSGPVTGDKLINSYLKAFSYRISMEAKILDNGEPDIIIDAIPANQI